ncbi:uncharacterized protein TNCV_1502001 [Trichonephila clavipes]|uniref:Uncharacterized protein n=1 Tax=Trichonephila clavipes TaxID=2585209 RepID=A0A8X6S136_TRICX|nr:uncharacterized protein TNCV_1502001 [Trichonephila clavipes]
MVILNHGQVTRTIPELAPSSPTFHTPPTRGRLSDDRFNVHRYPLHDGSSAIKLEDKIERIQKQVEERIKEQVEERIEGVVENFSLISQRMEDLEKKLQAGENENKSKRVNVSAFSEPVLASPVPVTAFTGPEELLTYDGKMSWEVYKTQFPINICQWMH